MKILVDRLKKILPKLFYEEQGAFVSGRSVSDNIILVQEILHSMHSSSRGRKLMV